MGRIQFDAGEFGALEALNQVQERNKEHGSMASEEAPQSEIILYQTEDGRTRIQCRFENETLWLTQALIAELFQVTPQNVTLHLKSIYEDGELEESATCKDYLQVRSDLSDRGRPARIPAIPNRALFAPSSALLDRGRPARIITNLSPSSALGISRTFGPRAARPHHPQSVPISRMALAAVLRRFRIESKLRCSCITKFPASISPGFFLLVLVLRPLQRTVLVLEEALSATIEAERGSGG